MRRDAERPSNLMKRIPTSFRPQNMEWAKTRFPAAEAHKTLLFDRNPGLMTGPDAFCRLAVLPDH